MIGDWAYATAVVVWAYGAGGAKLVGVWGAVRLLLMASSRRSARRSPTGCRARRCSSAPTSCAPCLVGRRRGPRRSWTPRRWSVLVVATLRCPRRLRLPAGPDGLDAVAHQHARGAHRRQRRLEHHREPGLLRRPGPRRAARHHDERPDRLPPQRRDVPALRGARLGHPPRGRATSTAPAPDDAEADADGRPAEKAACSREMGGGFTHIRRGPRPASWSRSSCAPRPSSPGATIVLGVTFAVDILERGPQAVGIIDSAFGVGAIVGGFFAIARATRNRLAGDLALGTALWSLPLLLIVVWPSPVTVFAAVILLGFGNPLVDVNFATIVQRLTPDAVLGRVFGAYEGALIATMALGSAVTPFLLERARAAVGARHPRARRRACPPWPSSPGACASTPRCARRRAPTCCAASRSSPRMPQAEARGAGPRARARDGTGRHRHRARGRESPTASSSSSAAGSR